MLNTGDTDMPRLRDIEGASSLTAFQIPPQNLKVDPDFNLRSVTKFDPDTRPVDRELVDSIKENGLLNPLMVTSDGTIVAGHRRYAAIMHAISEGAEIFSVPCVQEPKGFTPKQRVLTQITTNEGVPFERVELAAVIAKLSQMGMSDDEILKQTGKSRTWLANIYLLNSAPDELKEMVKDGELSANVAVDLIREHGANNAAVEEAKEVVEEAKAKGKKTATPKDRKAVKEKDAKPTKTLKNVLKEFENFEVDAVEVETELAEIMATDPAEGRHQEMWTKIAMLALQVAVTRKGSSAEEVAGYMFSILDGE